MTALHTELVDNLLEFERAIDRAESYEFEEGKAPVSLFPNAGFPTSAIESIRIRDPHLYAELDSNIPQILQVYHDVELYNKKTEDPRVDEITVEHGNIKQLLEESQQLVATTILELEEYMKETRKRKILYYNCTAESPSREYLEEYAEDSDEETTGQ